MDTFLELQCRQHHRDGHLRGATVAMVTLPMITNAPPESDHKVHKKLLNKDFGVSFSWALVGLTDPAVPMRALFTFDWWSLDFVLSAIVPII